MCPFVRNWNRVQTSGTCTMQPLVLFTQSFPFLGAERKPSPPPAGVPAHLNRRDHDSCSMFCICNCTDRWMLLHLQSQDTVRWVPLKFPSLHSGEWSSEFCLWATPTHQLSSLNSESDLFHLVLKPPLKYGGTQGKKTTLQQSWVPHPFALSVMAITSCHSLPGSLTWKTNVVHFPGILLWQDAVCPVEVNLLF